MVINFGEVTTGILVILASELGDKTFIMTAIMAMKYSRKSVFLGSACAAFMMIYLSVMIGAATSIIPRWVTHYFSIILFLYFGYQMLQEGMNMKPEDEEEEIKSLEQEHQQEKTSEQQGVMMSFFKSYFSPVFIEMFTINFLAEWGDRSQVSTIVLASRGSGVMGTFIGAIMGHLICITLAVIGGKIIGQWISIRSVTICGGIGFIGFALSSLLL